MVTNATADRRCNQQFSGARSTVRGNSSPKGPTPTGSQYSRCCTEQSRKVRSISFDCWSMQAPTSNARTTQAGRRSRGHTPTNSTRSWTTSSASAPDPSSRDRHGFSELHIAARSGDPDRCSRLLRAGVDVNARSADGSTALIIAAQTCDTTVAEALLRVLLHHRADPDLADYEGSVPLASAAYEDAAHQDADDGRIVRTSLLLDAGADPNGGTYPPVFGAISQEGRSWAAISVLLRSGANPDSTDANGITILHRATQTTTDGEFIARCAAVVRNVDRPDNSNATALDDAFWRMVSRTGMARAARPPTRIDRRWNRHLACGSSRTRVVDRIRRRFTLRRALEQASRFAELQRIVMATRAEFGNGRH